MCLNLKSYRLYFIFFLFLIFMVFNNFVFILNNEFYLLIIFNFIDLWEDYYEVLFNVNMNDFRVLIIGYYFINLIEFILIGLILLVGSVVCVNLNKI